MMSEFIGGRIIPVHGGVWEKSSSYEALTIVLYKATGDSYISRKAVPAGTAITDTSYWMLHSLYSQQIADAVGEMEETEAALRKELSDTEGRMGNRVSAAETLTNNNKSELNERMDGLDARLDANVAASTDSNADYAAEVVDARVGRDAKSYGSLGEAVRGQIGTLTDSLDESNTELTQWMLRYANESEETCMKVLPIWEQKTLSSDGEVEITKVESRATTDFIYVPKGMSAVIGYGSQTSDMEEEWAWRKVCVYDADKNFVEVYASSKTVMIHGECYFRVYVLRTPETADSYCSIQMFNSTMPAVNSRKIDDLKSNGCLAVSGSMISITDSSSGLFENVSFNGSTGSSLMVCGKNLFRLEPSRVKAVENNVTMEFSPAEGTVKVYTSEEGASAVYNGPHIVTSVNGEAFYGLYKIKFPIDTWITASANPSEFLERFSGIFMQISDGKNTIQVDRGKGYTFLAKAGVEYAVRLQVQSGWTNTEGVLFRPQIEIGTHRTEFEPFKGCIVNGNEPNEDCKELSKPDFFYASDYFWTSCGTDGTIFVKTKAPLTEEKAVYNETDLINGLEELHYFYRFTPDVETNIYIGCKVEPEKYKDYICIQATDGSHFYNDEGEGILIPNWPEGTECVVRLIAKAGLDCDWIRVTPVVRTGASVARSFNGLTNIIVSDGKTFSGSYLTQSKADRMELETGLQENVDLLTSGFISHPFRQIRNRRPLISFIDDDTTGVSWVKRYHDILSEYGVVGNYAVITARMTNPDRRYDEEGKLLALLKEYEMEGFGMLYHCYWQNSVNDPTLYFKLEERDISSVRNNLLAGLRDMQELGFNNYKFWVTPYGVDDEEIQNMAKELGMECLISMGNNSYISRGYADRWSIPRYSVSASSVNSDTKAAMDACAEEKGWINIVTHVNAWGDTPEVDVAAKLREIIEYAIEKGYEITSFPQAFERWRAAFLMHELF